MSEALIKVDGLSKKFCRSLKQSLWYGMQDLGRELIGRQHGGDGELRSEEFWAVKDVSFELKRGESLGLIGHNGAGKTTLLKMLNGLVKPDGGRIEMRGRVGALIALGAGFNPILTGRENIYVNGSILGLTKNEIDKKMDDIIDFSEIGDFIDSPVQTYSSGMAVRLGFAIAAKTEPDILLLDEVLAVGDVGFQAKCFNTIAEFRKRGTAFILVSHNMQQIARYSDKVLYLKRGRIETLGNTDTGIEKFLIDMNSSESDSKTDVTDWNKVYGSGKIIFTSARFVNSTGNEVDRIDSGEQVTLEIDYHKIDNQIGPPVLDVQFRDNDGIIYQGTNLADNHTFDSLKSIGKLQVILHELPLNSDYVDVNIAILNKQTLEVYDWKRNIRLNINRRTNIHGKLNLRIAWNSI